MKVYLNKSELRIIQESIYKNISYNREKLNLHKAPELTPAYSERLQDEIAEQEKLIIYINQKISDTED